METEKVEPVGNEVGFSFTPKRTITKDRLSEIWNKIETVKPMPMIEAFALDQNEFERVLYYFHNTGAKMEGSLWEHGRILTPDETEAFYFPLWMCKTKTEFLILIREREAEDEVDSLIHELTHIANKDYLKFAKGREIFKRFKGEIPID
jgi:hypothetical protein